MSDRAKALRISRALNYDYPSHSHPITSCEARKLGLNVRDLALTMYALLRDLTQVYSEMARAKIADYDTSIYHNGEICNILELVSRQVFYQVDKDWQIRQLELAELVLATTGGIATFSAP